MTRIIILIVYNIYIYKNFHMSFCDRFPTFFLLAGVKTENCVVVVLFLTHHIPASIAVFFDLVIPYAVGGVGSLRDGPQFFKVAD